MSRLPSGPRGWPILGILPRIWKDPLAFFTRTSRECGDVARVGVGKFTLYLVSNPEAIGRVFHENAANYCKGKGLAAAEAVMGQGLATSEGDLWQEQHRAIAPAFRGQRLAAYVAPIWEVTRGLLDGWRERLESDEPFDLAEDMRRLTLEVLCRALFGAALDADRERLTGGIEVAHAGINRSAWSFVPFLDRLPTPFNRRFRRGLARLDGLVYGKIREARSEPRPGSGFLLEVLAAKGGDPPSGMSDRQLRDEIVTLLMAGHDTLTNALSWTFHLLARHPDWARRVAEEAARVLGDQPPLLATVERLETAGRVFKESLRLYPPSWVIVRTPLAPDVLAGYSIPAGVPLLLSQYVLHRHPAYWDRPLTFDPGRWAPERSAGRHRFAYFPFGGGTRICTAMGLAMILGKLVVAMAAREFSWQGAPRRPVVPQPSTTLRPRNGVWVYVGRRKCTRYVGTGHAQECSLPQDHAPGASG